MSPAMMNMIGMVGFVVIIYVVLILPQRRREKKTLEMQNALKVGDAVVTIGGIFGKIVNIKEEELTIETSVEKSKIS